jgi:DNA polymerase-4
MTRKIIHVDMDCFYAAVEVKHNPKLKGKPLGVGGPAESRSVLCTASYEARKFGVRSAMPSSTAKRLCPNLIIVPPQFDLYKKESRAVRDIFERYTQRIEPLSLDEAYLDVSGSSHCLGSATLIAREIRGTIEKELGLTASAGVAPNKFLAKVASDWNKPNGQFVIRPCDVD